MAPSGIHRGTQAAPIKKDQGIQVLDWEAETSEEKEEPL